MLVLLIVYTQICFGDEAQKSPPNIVYILADDMGYGDIAYLNNQAKIKTPNLDKLSSSGMIFTDAHSGSSVCTPTRYGIVTGRYAWRSRLKKGVLGGDSPHLIPEERFTVAKLMKSAGYHTAMIGKWHLGWDFQKTANSNKKNEIDFSKKVLNGPDINGFDYYYGHCGSLDMGPYVYVENGNITALPDKVTSGTGKGFWRKSETASDFKHIDVLPNFFNRACKYIEERADKKESFFLYLPIPAPHTPILPIDQFQGKSGTNEYGDFVMQVDWHVGQIMEMLEKKGIRDNTIIIFTADNGCSPTANFEELAKVGHNPSYNFRGHKADIFEGGHRVPFIVSWPASVKAGSRYDGTICLTDLMATAAAITSTKIPENGGEDSVSFLPALQGKTEQLREATVHHSIDGSFSIRKGDWKLIMCAGSGGWSAPSDKQALKDGLPAIQLYNLKTDVGEQKNVFAENSEIVKELYSLLKQYIENGRSTPGAKQKNEGEILFEEEGFDKIKEQLKF